MGRASRVSSERMEILESSPEGAESTKARRFPSGDQLKVKEFPSGEVVVRRRRSGPPRAGITKMPDWPWDSMR